MFSRVRWTKINTVLALILTLFLALASPLLAQEKSIVWDRFDVDIDVSVDGSFSVAEKQTIRFTKGTFTFGFREIPIRNFSYINDWAIVDGSGNVYTQSSGDSASYTFTVEKSDYDYVIRWYFPPIANDSETYTLSYTVHGGLRYYEGGDQLWWKAIYSDRSFPVLAGDVEVNIPGPAVIQEWAAYINGADARDSATASVSDTNKSVLFSLTRRLNAGEDFEVRVEFTPGVVDGVPAAWQSSADAAAERMEAEARYYERWSPIAGLGLGGLGLLLLIGGPAALYALWYRLGRDRPVELVADYLPEPPDDLPPGIAGTLIDEQVDMEDVLATLVDLARRKVISITEDEEDGFFRKSTDFIYRREREDVALLPYEETLLYAVFGHTNEARLSDLKEKFYTELKGIKKDMYESATEMGFFPRSPETVRTQWGCLGVLGLGAAVVVGIILMMTFGDLTAAAMLPGCGLGLTAIGLLILSRHMPRKTDNGSETAARWRAFKRYLKDIDKYSDIEEQKVIWDRWLPYAIAFGIEKQYIRKFEKVDAPAPGWYIPSPSMYGPYRRRYYGMPGNGSGDIGGGMPEMGGGDGQSFGGSLGDASSNMGRGLAGMSAGLGTMLSSANSTFTSRPASSSSGGGWSSGGGGFSGGGSFGGGGGGGGGGGFG
jgi:hypothetical protein